MHGGKQHHLGYVDVDASPISQQLLSRAVRMNSGYLCTQLRSWLALLRPWAAVL